MTRLESMTKKALISEIDKLREKVRMFEDIQWAFDESVSGGLEGIPLVGIDNLVEGIWIINKDGETVFVNPTMAELLEYSPEEMFGQHLFEFMEESAKAYCEDNLSKRMNGIKEVHDFIFRSKTGKSIFTRVATSPINNKDGEYEGAIANIIDISDTHRLQERLKSNFENAPIGMGHMDLDGKFILVNQVLCDLLGYSAEELVGMTNISLTHPDDKKNCLAYKNIIVAGGTHPKLEKRHVKKDGEVVWVLFSLSLVRDDTGKAQYFVAAMEDISNVKRAEHALQSRLHLLQFAAVHSLEKLMTEILDVLEEMTGSQVGYFYFLESDQKTLSLQAKSTNATRKMSTAEGLCIDYSVDSAGAWEDCLRKREPVIQNGSHSLSCNEGGLGHTSLLREMVVPVFRKDTIVALVGLGNKPSPYTRKDVDSVSFLADVAWDIVDQKMSSLQVENMAHFPDENPNPIIRVDQDGVVLYANSAARFLLDSIGTEQGTKLSSKMRKLLLSASSLSAGGLSDFACGDRFFSLSIISIADSGQVNIYGMDTTERVKAEQEAAWNLRVNMALARLYPPLVSPNANLKNTSEVILSEALKVTDSQHGYTCSITHEGIAIQAFSDMMGSCHVVGGHDGVTFPKDSDGHYPLLWGHSLNTGKPFFTNSPIEHPSSKGIPEGHIKLECFLSVPVFLEGNLVGQISVANKVGGYSAADLDVLMRMASYYALALQRVRSKKELIANKELQESILNGIKIGVMVIDPGSKVIESINSVALEMLRAAEEDVVGQKCDIFCWQKYDGSDIEKCPMITADIRERELRMRRMDGSILPVSKTVLEQTVDGEKKYLELFFDITDRKELERKLNLAQKLEAIGQLSAGIAHEINTPAQYLGDNLKFFSGAFDDVLDIVQKFRTQCIQHEGQTERKMCIETNQLWTESDMDYLIAEIPSALSQSQEGIRRISSIVKAMKQFSHPGVESKQLADINRALESTVTVCRNEWKYYSNVVYELSSDLPKVSCYINDLNQVFLNVVVNAAHAIASKEISKNELGDIIIRTWSEDNQVLIEIADTGEGIPESILPKIFDPFFTTKDVGLGTGQGLALCYSIIVDKHGGTIDFISELGVGTSCLITLPIDSSRGNNDT